MAVQKIFPSAQLGATYPECRVFYEHNVTNLISQIVDKDIFVISYDSNTKVLKFNIQGYYVEYQASLSNVWVNKTLTFSESSENPELKISGISITETEPETTNNYYQLLINGAINPEYQIKFDITSLPSIIDCGTINN